MSTLSVFETMQHDMQIHPYYNEDHLSHYSRTIYSGLGEWIKTAAYDKYIENLSDGSSKQYITQKVQKILDVYIDALSDESPKIRDWFYPDETAKPIQEIRDRLEAAGSLVSHITNTLQYPLPKCTKISESLYLYRGNIGKHPDRVIGLGTYLTENTDIPEVSFSEMFTLPEIPANIFVDEYLAYVKDEFTLSPHPPETRRYFQSGLGKAFYKSWGNQPDLTSVTLYKDSENEYGLVKIIHDKQYTVRFPKSYISQDETRRFAYGLWYKAQKPARVWIHNHDEEYCTIRLSSWLPVKEQSALYQLAWSKSDLLDRREYIAPIEVLPVIETMLKNLCMEVKYQ